MSDFIKVTTKKVINYKGHKIRVCEDELSYPIIVIDNDSDYIDRAPISMKDEDFTYCSLSDAKRCINGLQPIYVPFDIVDYEITNKRYFNRFKK